MNEYSASFEAAVDHAMLWEVGGFWNVNTPGVKEGLISSQVQRRNVGYVNDPLDRGGETKYGVAKNANMDLNITTLDWAAAKRVYYRRYWLAANCDDLTLISPRLAVLHFDGAVNHGVGRAGRFLQQAVGAVEDGDVGPATLREVQNDIKSDADAIKICALICTSREQFYRAIVARRPEQVRFLRGWMARINDMRAFTTSPTKQFA